MLAALLRSDFPVVHHGAPVEDFILEIDDELAFLHQQSREGRDIHRIQLRGMHRHLTGNILGTPHGDLTDEDLLTGDRTFDVAARFTREVDDDRSGLHRLDHGACHEQRSLPTGHGSGGNHDVGVGDVRVSSSRCAPRDPHSSRA